MLGAQLIGLLLSAAALAVSGEAAPAVGSLAWGAVAGIGGLVGLVGLYLALARGTMGIVAPMTALVAATVPAAVGIAAGERPGPAVLVGMVVALVAVVVIGLPERGGALPAPTTDGRPRPSTPGATDWLLVVLAGLGFASFYLGVDRAHQDGAGAWWTLVAVRLAASAVVVALAVGLRVAGRMPELRPSARVLGLVALAALGDTAGNLLYILSRAAGELSVTVVLVSLYPVSTVLLARLVLGERLSRLRLAGVGLAVAGAALIGARRRRRVETSARVALRWT